MKTTYKSLFFSLALIFSSAMATASENYLDSLFSEDDAYKWDEDYHADSNSFSSLFNYFSADNPIPLERFFTEETFLDEPLFLEFDTVIVINKANKGFDKQTLRLFKKGRLILQTLVSTGREQWEGSEASGTKPTRQYFSATGVGYFAPTWLKEMHVSTIWKTEMPWSIFFNGGIAIHQAPPTAENKLGTRASGGCVRVSKTVAEEIFNLVKGGGIGPVPAMNRDGTFQYDARGNVVRKKTYRSMVIVQEAIF